MKKKIIPFFYNFYNRKKIHQFFYERLIFIKKRKKKFKLAFDF